jgi:hypothetical protein
MTDIEEFSGEYHPGGSSFSIPSLVELCLLTRTSHEGAWWRLLETVRGFSLNKLDDAALKSISERHPQGALEKPGTYPHDQVNHFKHAQWGVDH